ncbi:helix-turn-helix domain-containing protein [Micromonospora echinofusca]|uniref:helix-turn-helix domain-containing protein n=1 Tax=Micromonospora echinofusca TaxID=47858 RepID=UPI00340A5FAB
MATTSPLKLWTVDDVADYLGVPVQTLYTWRKRRIGPPAGRVGRHLRYDPDAVRAWFEQQAAA